VAGKFGILPKLFLSHQSQYPAQRRGGNRRWLGRQISDRHSGGVATIEITEPGLHTLHLWQREDGLRVDRIVLTTNSGYNPTGDGPVESEFE
jgi:hypothetical protein